MAETGIPQDVRELAERYAEKSMGGVWPTTIAKIIARAIMADRAAHAPDPSREMLVEALRGLVAKLDLVEEASRGFFIAASVHGFKYDGPNYEAEITTARATLSAIEASHDRS